MEAAGGIAALVGLTLLFTYANVDPETAQNPAWATFGYPGPIAAPNASAPRPIEPIVPDGDTVIEADAVIVGSGAGGGVIAAKLAAAGLSVVVLEMGGYHTDADFNQLELWAWQNLYWRGGPNPTADMNVTLQAGSGLGGGTVINWTNSLRTKDWVRSQWAEEHGLDGRRHRGLRPPPRRGLGADQGQRRMLGVQQAHPGDAACRGASRMVVREDQPQLGPGQARPRDGGLHGLRRPLGRQAVHRPHLPARRRRARRPDHGGRLRGAGARRGRPGGGRRGAVERPGRGERACDRARPAGGRGRGLARVARAAAAIGDRRPGDRRVPATAPLLRPRSATTGRTRRPGGERRRAG